MKAYIATGISTVSGLLAQALIIFLFIAGGIGFAYDDPSKVRITIIIAGVIISLIAGGLSYILSKNWKGSLVTVVILNISYFLLQQLLL